MSNPPAASRRFICLACGWIHLTWAARCSSCLSLQGLTLFTGTEAAVPTPAPTGIVPEEEPVMMAPPELPERPRLMIVRAPSPEPELEDPVEELADVASPTSVPLSDISETTFERDLTGLTPLDYVLGGGLVVASVILFASPRGIGKSSLALQMLNGLGHRCLYVSGEETLEQVAMTARRIGAASKKVNMLPERNLSKILAEARAIRAQTIVIDSIQKMRCADVGGRAGSPGQLKECTARLVDYAKSNRTSLWLIGHTTSDGDIAGPMTIEHEVDVILELTQGAKFEGNERILTCLGKNRFGPSNLVGHFELTAKGFVSVDADGWDEEL